MIEIREEAFKYYFIFMHERMNIFWKRFYKMEQPWTNDEIIYNHRFTNVYRVCDRVSQYLISKVIYNNNFQNNREEDIILRILIFKIFNKIDTWDYLTNKYGEIDTKTFNHKKISELLSVRINETPIFNSAYLMPGSHSEFAAFKSKHSVWLQMVNKYFINGPMISKLINCNTLEQLFNTLKTCPLIGEFLAYQYAIDLNYSPVFNFDENSFVKAGSGAIRGIKKCFLNTGGLSNDDIIKYTYDNMYKYKTHFKITIEDLFGREPKLIDLQNCFCETDKYLRVKMPELKIQNVRIKQKYKIDSSDINYFFPPKWNIKLI